MHAENDSTPDAAAPQAMPLEAMTPAEDPTACSRAIALDTLKRGHIGVIDHIELPESDALRLMRLGLVPGREVTVLRPGSRPLIATAGARLALDQSLARGVMIVDEEDVK